MKILFALLIGLCLNQLCHAQADPVKVEGQLNIVYVKLGDWEGKLDLYLPKNKKQNALVIYIHGGGWTHGNKEAEYEKIKVFIENGYAVANVAYRLAGQAPAPAAVEDVNTAIAFLLKNSKKYHFDQNKLVLMGASAGAHLALLVGLQSNQVLFPGTSGLQQFKVAAMISKYGPTDLQTWAPAMDPKSASATWLGNRLNDVAFVQSLSPINYANGTKIPVLFVHGDQDQTVPLTQAQVLYEQLKKNHHPTELYVVKNGKHGNFGPIESPKMDAKMLGFLKFHLR